MTLHTLIEQTPISLAEMFPPEYDYLKAKLHPELA